VNQRDSTEHVLVVSDLHLGLGGEHDDFQADEEFAAFLAWGAGAGVRTLVVAGDALDFVACWGRTKAGPGGRLAEAEAVELAERILSAHPEVAAALAGFAGTPGHRLVFVVGNHDMPLLFPMVQAALRRRLGPSVEFHRRKWVSHGFRVEHGHQFEPANAFDPDHCWVCGPDEEPWTHGERQLDLPWGTWLVADYLARLEPLDPVAVRIRPVDALLRWLLLHRPVLAIRAALAFVGFVLRGRFLGSARRRERFRRTVEVLRGACLGCPYLDEARGLLEPERVHTVVLGHTHVAGLWELGEGRYLNTGTWSTTTVSSGSSLVLARRLTFVVLDVLAEQTGRASLMEWRPGVGAVLVAGEALLCTTDASRPEHLGGAA